MRAVVSDGIGKAAAKHATRASMQTTMYDQFNVVAQLKKSDGNIAPRYYMNEVATKQGVVWQPSSSIYYWPDNGSLRFLAWAPIDAELDESPVKPSEDVNKTTIKYTVPADLSKQRDLVAAATGYNASPEGGVCAPVSLQFKHLCTAVVVKTGATMAPGTIKSVTVTNVRNSGTYDMLRSVWTLNDATTSYTVSPNMATGSTTAEGTKLNADDATFMLLPQTLGVDSKLEVMFHDNISGRDRLLTASLNGAEWPMGKTVTYRLSITPEYELEFTSEPQVQDAHYVIYPIKIKVDPGLTGGWKLKSTSPKVTLCKELTELTSLGYWIEEDRGTQAIEGTETGEITVYAFIEENVTNAERDLVLELSPKGIPSATPAKFTIRQLCPSWNTDGLGCERFEDGKYPWGFLWNSSMKITYDMRDAGGHGFWGPLRRVKLVNHALKVTSPARVLGTLLCFLVVPAEHIVTWITIVETSGHHEIDTFISEICTINREVVSRHRIRRGKKQQHRCKELLLKLSHKKNIKLRYLVENYLFAKLIRKRWNCKQTSLYSLFFICKRLHLQVK